MVIMNINETRTPEFISELQRTGVDGNIKAGYLCNSKNRFVTVPSGEHLNPDDLTDIAVSFHKTSGSLQVGIAGQAPFIDTAGLACLNIGRLRHIGIASGSGNTAEFRLCGMYGFLILCIEGREGSKILKDSHCLCIFSNARPLQLHRFFE